MGAQVERGTFVFQADGIVLLGAEPFPYELLPGGLRIGQDEYIMSVSASELGLLHASSFTSQCSRLGDGAAVDVCAAVDVGASAVV